MKKEYIDINKKAWNQRTDIHYTSDFYNTKSFIEGRNSLKKIELDLLGDIKGKSILHLQCHFGMDTISLSRLGAKVTGMDLSDKSIAKAKELAKITGTDTKFVCCDIFDLPNHLDEKFDIVFTSYGVISWLPDLKKWADVISNFLKPKGEFVMVEFHPILNILDIGEEEAKVVHTYFNVGPDIEDEEFTYTDTDKPVSLKDVVWCHSIGDILSSLLGEQLEILNFEEFDYSFVDCFGNMEEYVPGKFRFKAIPNQIPILFSVKAKKK